MNVMGKNGKCMQAAVTAASDQNQEIFFFNG
jgi:hypothetical protein